MLALLVFLAEISVVTLCTMRIIFVARGMRVIAPILGFFEVTIWLFAIRTVMQNLDDISCFLAFAAGFALGNYFGILLEEKLAIGTSLVRIISTKDPSELIRNLSLNDFGVTCVEGQGATGPVQIVLTVVKRKDIDRVTDLVRQFDPKVFYSIGEVQAVNEGIFASARGWPGLIPSPFRFRRKESIHTTSAMS